MEFVKSFCVVGIDYVIVDDYYFMSVGFLKDELFWLYYIEDGGEVIMVFLIDEKFRYLIFFCFVDKIFEYLYFFDDGDESKVVVFYDDGEKFGVWFGIYEWVYEKGWFREFFDRVLSDERINFMFYFEYF